MNYTQVAHLIETFARRVKKSRHEVGGSIKFQTTNGYVRKMLTIHTIRVCVSLKSIKYHWMKVKFEIPRLRESAIAPSAKRFNDQFQFESTYNRVYWKYRGCNIRHFCSFLSYLHYSRGSDGTNDSNNLARYQSLCTISVNLKTNKQYCISLIIDIIEKF